MWIFRELPLSRRARTCSRDTTEALATAGDGGAGPSSRGAHSPWCRCCSSSSRGRGWRGVGAAGSGWGQQLRSGLSPPCAAAAAFSPCVRPLWFWGGEMACVWDEGSCLFCFG